MVGDDGVGGIALDPYGAGAPYLRMQRYLKELSEAGIPLSAVSKNDPEAALLPFRERPEMILRREDFVYFEASWGNKHVAIRSIAERCNLALSQICFLDDSPPERQEAAHFLPELVIPELPEDPEERATFLIHSRLLLTPALTPEDRKRAESYRSEARRQEARVTIADTDAFLKSLAMRLTPHRIDKFNIDRVAALINKTNQFNLTGRRHNLSFVAEFSANAANYAHCFSLSDRFGDAGIISVLLGERQGDELLIDTWVMSCRVFGRWVEAAIFEHLAAWCRCNAIAKMHDSFRPTARNTVVADLYPQLGFCPGTTGKEGRNYHLNLPATLSAHHLSIDKHPDHSC